MSWTKEKHKKGKRFYGWFLKNSVTGVVVYIARRRHKEIFRTGEATISDAMRKGIACWAIDVETLSLCRIKGVKYVGVKVIDQGSLYLTTLDRFTRASVKNYASRGGSLQRYLELDEFKAVKTISI